MISIMVLPQTNLIIRSRTIIVPPSTAHRPSRNCLKVVQTEDMLQIGLDILLRLGRSAVARVGLLAHLKCLRWRSRGCLGWFGLGEGVGDEGPEVFGGVEVVCYGVGWVDWLRSGCILYRTCQVYMLEEGVIGSRRGDSNSPRTLP